MLSNSWCNIKTLHPQSTVAILLGTLNGQRFLAEQLDSIAEQSYTSWQVYASDDGSIDGTLALLKHYQTVWGQDRFSLHQGPKSGFASNFLSLACNSEIEADFYAYADQDDIWHPNKLERALQWLRHIPATQPSLYCARTQLIDRQGRFIGLSPLFNKPPSFANALVQSIAGGNTMVFNRAARQLLCQAGQHTTLITHDWWTYLLVTGCGGKVFYDEIPTVSYRQHSKNLVGSNLTWGAKVSRAKKLLLGSFRAFNDRNIAALHNIRDFLSTDHCKQFDQFCSARREWLLPRLFKSKQAGIYRQTRLDNLALIIALLMNKV